MRFNVGRKKNEEKFPFSLPTSPARNGGNKNYLSKNF